MGKKAARRSTAGPPVAVLDGEVPVVGGREPCPCGSGRRYKACHGREAAAAADVLVRRPFAGLPSECDWVALREIVPAATAPLRLRAQPEQPVTLATVLPLAWPALRRQDGSILLGLQTPTGSGDLSRDVADALERALGTEPGNPVPPSGLPGPGARLQDLLDVERPLEVAVRDGFEFWVEGTGQDTPEVQASLERANAAVVPTRRLVSVDAAYWAQVRDRVHLRWVLPYDEEPLLDALARLHAGGGTALGPGSRFIGTFRAHGLLVPVWDLPAGTGADDVEDPAVEFDARLREALGHGGPLTDEERRARAGLLNRQLTLR